MTVDYLPSVIKQFEYYKNLGDKTFVQLNDDQIYFRPNNYSNNISIIVKHIVGNMLSRWTNFLKEDGEKEWRNREGEFEDTYKNKKEMITAWEKGWQCLLDMITSLTADDLNKVILIRNQEQSVMDAINRQLAHYPYHIGQIVYLGTLLKGDQWQSLSIPKGQSLAYNKEKFRKGKHAGHFTDDFK